MATQRQIQSPGVQINEIDLSLRPNIPVGVNVFLTGYTSQGPTDEIIQVTSLSEYEEIFGLPYNAAERYAYHSIKPVLDSSANVWFSRLPYGDNSGDIFANEKYSALIYPVLPEDGATHFETLSTAGLSAEAADTFWLMKPTHVELTRDQYDDLQSGVVTWNNAFGKEVDYTDIANVGNAALVVLNTSQTTINDKYEGYYLGISDNRNTDPASSYTDVTAVNSVNNNVSTETYVTIPTSRLDFKLSATNANDDSLSEVMENLSKFDLGTSEFNDTLSLGLFKIRRSAFNKDAISLNYVLAESYVGSIDGDRKIQNENGGEPLSFFLENVDDSSSNVKVLVNPNLASTFSLALTGTSYPTKSIRVLDQNSSPSYLLSAGYTSADYANELFPVGVYKPESGGNKKIGNLVGKVERVMDLIENPEIYQIDVSCEAGLGTIFCSNQELSGTTYDETTAWPSLSGLTEQAETLTDATTVNNYTTVFNLFENFARSRRKDHLFIADGVRHVFIRGTDTKIMKQKGKTFSANIYWPLRNVFKSANSSYATTYANWVKVYDKTSDKQIWAPYSGFAANLMTGSDVWDAPAGFTRGINRQINDIAISPNQKQRDQLYKINLNPIYYSPIDGYVTMGQKTLQRKPSAFDRINVRRTFLFLEKATLNTVRYFVFENNTLFTRTQVVNVLTPIFEDMKNIGGVYDYRLICDERNNTSSVIDNNELVVDLYIKPTRSGEFLICNFYATRTSQNFDELI